MDLHAFWFIMLGLMLTLYAILDGFDLGVGLVYWVAHSDEERRLFLSSIGPLWDGNEVWLVCFGGALFGAFPEVYATLFSGFYLPFMALLLALLLRAVSIEFRDLEDWRWWRRLWDLTFFGACGLACFVFGLMVANALDGLPIGPNKEFSGSISSLGGYFPVAMGLFSCVLFGLHGALYLNMRLQGALRRRVRRTCWALWGIFVALHIILSWYVAQILTPLEGIMTHKSLATAALLLNVVAVVALAFFLYEKSRVMAFMASALNIATLSALVGATLFPNLLVSELNPAWNLTIYNSSSTLGTLGLMRWVAVAGTPFAIGYTVILYWVFRGPVKAHKHR